MIRILTFALAALALSAGAATAQEFFYTYSGDADEHRLSTIYVTQQDADAAASGDAALFANQGAVVVPRVVATGWTRNPPSTTWLSPSGTTADDLRQLRGAARDMLGRFAAARAFLNSGRLAWPAAQIEKARAGIERMTINAARFALSPDKTAADRMAFLEGAAAWPIAADGDARHFIAAFVPGVATPGVNYSWVNPATSPPTRYTDPADIATGFSGATDVAAAPSGRWFRDIP